jgi:hypothetical protein
VLELEADTCSAVREDALAEKVASFQRLRPYWFAAQDQCLFHALALRHFLRAYGIAVSWVIGVRTLPWGAHSWLQTNNCLIDATPEEVREYVPILCV